jgi:hypothetical protein
VHSRENKTVRPLALLAAAMAFAGSAMFAGTAHAQDTSQWLAESRKAAGSLVQQLGAQLRATLEAQGADGAVTVCKDIAPALAGQLSRETGWRVARVSLRTRNPLLGTPDAWEQNVLAEFDRRVAAGEKPDALEFAEVVEEPGGRYYRYLKAIPTGPLCVTCHGPVEQMSPAIVERLQKEYPHDRATGYAPGQVRGGVTVKRRVD